MMKFFRKHNKELLAVFMVLLMIVFLGGSALNNLLTPSMNRVVAHTRLGDISFQDQQTARHFTDILERTGQSWSTPFFGVYEPITTTEWIILTREAEELGLASTTSASVNLPADINEWARVLRVKPSHIVTAYAQLAAIRQTGSAVANASSLSEAEILAAARDALEKVRVGVAMLPAEAFVDETREFSESELQAQFEKYQETEAGPGLEFGYYVQPEVQVQYIRIDRDVIKENVRIASLDRKAKAFFDENRQRRPEFRRPPEEMQIEPLGEDEHGPPQPPPPPYLNWEEARETAVELVKIEEAGAAAQRIADWVVQYTAEPWIDVERDEETHYKTAPERVSEEGYYDLVLSRVPHTIAYPEAVSTRVSEFFNQENAEEVEAIGAANFRPERGAWESLRTLAFRSPGAVPAIPVKEGANVTDYLSFHETSRYPLADPDGNVYVFRVVGSRPGHVPESIDEVRDRVIADLRLAKAYETARARAESLRSCAETETLAEAFESDLELVMLAEEGVPGIGYFDPAPFSRTTGNKDPISRADAGRFINGDIGMVPHDIVEEIFALAHAPVKSRVFELPGRATVMAVEWLETIPPDGDAFVDMRETLVLQVSMARTREALRDWMDAEKIRARNGFAFATEQ